MSTTVPTLSTPRPPNSTQTPSAGNSARNSTDTAPSIAASPLPSRSSSRQASLVSPATANGPALGGAPPAGSSGQSSRRTRAALRDYYGLKKATEQQQDSTDASSKDGDDSAAEWGGGIVANRELDAPGFDAQTYVDGLLSSQGLDALLREESGLINEIKFLTSERAALVYDNYSKLIAATDTIQRMRSNMAPLAPQTSTLAPAVGHIAETAQKLAYDMGAQSPRTERNERSERRELGGSGGGEGTASETSTTAAARTQRRRDRETVRWVLDAPRRIRDDGPEAAEWAAVHDLLKRWQGKGVDVEGVEALRRECERAVEERGLAPVAKA